MCIHEKTKTRGRRSQVFCASSNRRVWNDGVRDLYTLEFVTYIYIYTNRPRLAAEDLKFFELAAKDAYGTMKFLIFMQ